VGNDCCPSHPAWERTHLLKMRTTALELPSSHLLQVQRHHVWQEVEGFGAFELILNDLVSPGKVKSEEGAKTRPP